MLLVFIPRVLIPIVLHIALLMWLMVMLACRATVNRLMTRGRLSLWGWAHVNVVVMVTWGLLLVHLVGRVGTRWGWWWLHRLARWCISVSLSIHCCCDGISAIFVCAWVSITIEWARRDAVHSRIARHFVSRSRACQRGHSYWFV